MSEPGPLEILVLTDRFTPEISAPSFRISEHARVWRELGHGVTVVTCAPNHPRGVVFPGYRNRLYQEEDQGGVRVVRVWSYMTTPEGTVKRTLDYMSFMLSAVLQCPRFPAFDVLLATSPTFFTAMAGYAVSRLRRRPWIFEIRDLWPASIRAVGVSRSRALHVVEQVELYLYRRADRIVSLTHSFRDDLVLRGIPAGKNDVVTNGVDTGFFHPGAVTFDARQRLGVARDAFLGGYIGTTGLAHGLTTLLDAAQRCLDSDRIRFLIMGEGAERADLEREAARRGLGNVLFRDFVPHGEIPSYLAALDASIVHLRPDPVFKTVIPSKIFESMAMGVPILMAVEGESARIVEECGAGLCVPSGDPQAMAATVRRMAADPGLCRTLGRQAAESVKTRYSRRALALAALESLRRARDGWDAEGVRPTSNQEGPWDEQGKRQ